MINKRAVHEIVLFIENDANLYRQMYTPIVINYAKKVIAKTYNHEKAVKGVVNLVDEGIRRYRKEFGVEGAREYGLGPGVSMETKIAAAKEILSGMKEEIRGQVEKMKKEKSKARKPEARKPARRK